MKIPFNIPYFSGNENSYISDVLNHTHYDKHESFTDKCINRIKREFNYRNIYLTSSCTAALEASALALEIKKGDEIIVPSFTFPSTANAFIRQGANLVFADSRIDHPGMDENRMESLITNKTRAIVPVHYAGVACDMDKIIKIAEKHGLFIIEDAAHSFGSSYKSKPLGSFGQLACLSFHQSKNLQCEAGGAIIINDKKLLDRVAAIIEKGTNRIEFLSGKVDRYEWVEIGSSCRMSELHAAFLFAQLEKADWIKSNRLHLWYLYFNSLKILEDKGLLKLPYIPDYADHNAHTFYLVLKNQKALTNLMDFLKAKEIQTVVHYTSLENSIFWKKNHNTDGKNINSLHYNDCLMRLPLYNSMIEDEILYVIENILDFFNVPTQTDKV